MLKKNLVLGSLAGATLLVGAAFMMPATAGAVGLMTGVCNTCHTMHDSQGGADQGAIGGGPKAQLLLWDGCTGCHTGAANVAGGKSASLPYAPQVGSAASGSALAGGYFPVQGTDQNMMHSVTGLEDNDTLTIAPGSGGAFDQTAGVGQISCVSCHGDAVGGHHSYTAATAAKTGAAGSSYRMLNADNNNDGVKDSVATQLVASYSATSDSATWGFGGGAANTVYKGTTGNTLNNFCASCHGLFHGAGNQVAAGAFVRHPTDVTLTAAGYTMTGTPDIALGADGVANDVVMCISCHKPHGSANADLLRFSYGSNTAGGTQDVGCESCHGAK